MNLVEKYQRLYDQIVDVIGKSNNIDVYRQLELTADVICQQIAVEYARAGNREQFNCYGIYSQECCSVAEENGHYGIAIDCFLNDDCDLKEDLEFYIPYCSKEQIVDIVTNYCDDNIDTVIAAIKDKELAKELTT